MADLLFDGDFFPRSFRFAATNEQAQYDWRFGYDAKRVKGLVDFQIYTDDLAKEMGVLPPLRKIFFQKPKLWFAIMFGPVRRQGSRRRLAVVHTEYTVPLWCRFIAVHTLRHTRRPPTCVLV